MLVIALLISSGDTKKYRKRYKIYRPCRDGRGFKLFRSIGRISLTSKRMMLPSLPGLISAEFSRSSISRIIWASCSVSSRTGLVLLPRAKFEASEIRVRSKSKETLLSQVEQIAEIFQPNKKDVNVLDLTAYSGGGKHEWRSFTEISAYADAKICRGTEREENRTALEMEAVSGENQKLAREWDLR